jgi:hypothetical protein
MMNTNPLINHPLNPNPFTSGPVGWQALLEGYPWFEGDKRYPIPAYSEFMPPPRLGHSPYNGIDSSLYNQADVFGWPVAEMEEEYELKPGLQMIANKVLEHLGRLGQGQIEPHLAGHKGENLKDNPYWPPELAANAGRLPAERYVIFLPLALSRTQDDLGRIRWTLFGSSEQGPERAFWKGFYQDPVHEIPTNDSLEFIYNILSSAYGVKVSDPQQLARIGFRILPTLTGMESYAHGESLPSWTYPFLIHDEDPLEAFRYLLTFRPFSSLPANAKRRYLAGDLALLPFPGSLVFWGMPSYISLSKKLVAANQIPLLHLIGRHGGPAGIRVPQSGWIHEPHPDVKPSDVRPELLVETYHRTHRWNRVHRYEDELAINPRLLKVAKTLFANDLETLGLYDKPMARNCQLWTREFKLLLDGPQAGRPEIERAEKTLAEGGLFGYRFLFPPMQIGRHEVIWHRLLAAFRSPQTGEAQMINDAPLGYLTAYPVGVKNLANPVELWPRLLRRRDYLASLQNFETAHDHYPHQTALNLLTLLEDYQQQGERPLRRSFARAMLRIAKHETLEEWLSRLPDHANPPQAGVEMQARLEKILEPVETTQTLPAELTFNQTASRVFEAAYWKDIFDLSHGNFPNVDNADCIDDPATLSRLSHHQRDLERLGDYLISRHRDAIEKAGMAGLSFCGELPFHWQTDFDFPKFGGWKKNQTGQTHERNILVIIPGQDRTQAVVLADHYDTAYMEDLYDPARGGSGARIAAKGADDNHSATATLLQAAPVYLKMAHEGRLKRDIWLLHLTGEEFPADCMGARHFSAALVEKTLKIRLHDDRLLDLSGVRIVGVYVMDMIAHNRDNDQDTFQISPGKSARSLQLAWHAHSANCLWNSRIPSWNNQADRRGKGRGKRSQDGITIPETAEILPLEGEIRTVTDPQSSLYNTDGQIFSDTGIPVVLFMENYDINRTGYHDTKDTLENIDLDYGAALAAIAIETAARAAAEP